MSQASPLLSAKILTPVVLVTALGYLVDVYDILLFNVVRVTSLTDLGLSGAALTDAGLMILNWQMAGLLLGGLFFGIMGDKVGRKSCLLASILTYSLSTLGCAFVQDEFQYAALRFIAGLGLSGEVGIGVSLVIESVVKEKRGLATTLFCVIGISGAILAAVAATYLDWRLCYLIGGLAGLALLSLRAVVCESGLFEKIRQANVERGNLLMFLKDKKLGVRYLACIVMGMPIYVIIGFIWTLAPEIGKTLGIVEVIKPAMAIGVGHVGLVCGDGVFGLLSHYMKSRLKPVLLAITLTGALLVGFYLWRDWDATKYYVFCFLTGLSGGYWVNMVTIAAEQFGTNLRATAATSIPNFVRGSLLPMNLALAALKPEWGILMATLIIGGVVLVMALWALTLLEETFHKDLDYAH